MEKNFLKRLKGNWRLVTLIVTGAVILGLVFSLIQPLKYQASVELLVIQKQDPSVDAYTAIKSAEKLGSNLAQIIYTTSFFDKVMRSGFAIQDDFSRDEIKKRKEWKEMIDTQVAQESGMLTINVYHRDKTQAAQIAEAIAYVLATEGDQYHGAGKNVTIKTVDSVLTSRYPVRPNIPVNLFTSLVLGILASVGLVTLKSSRQLEVEDDSPNDGPQRKSEIAPEAVLPQADLSFGRLALAEEPIENGPEFNTRFDPRVNSNDGIWTMHDHLDSITETSGQLLYGGELVEM